MILKARTTLGKEVFSTFEKILCWNKITQWMLLKCVGSVQNLSQWFPTAQEYWKLSKACHGVTLLCIPQVFKPSDKLPLPPTALLIHQGNARLRPQHVRGRVVVWCESDKWGLFSDPSQGGGHTPWAGSAFSLAPRGIHQTAKTTEE